MESVGGLVNLTVDGNIVSVKAPIEYELGGFKRDIVIGHDGIHGDKATPKPAYIRFPITDRAGLDVFALSQLRNATIYAKLRNGKNLAFYGMTQTGQANQNSEEGEIMLEFSGIRGEEI